MKNSKSVIAVKFNSTHKADKLMAVCNANLQDFKNVKGLIQKYYITEESTGALSGVYIFENKDYRAAFIASDLAKDIPATYGVIPESLRIEQYEMAIELN